MQANGRACLSHGYGKIFLIFAKFLFYKYRFCFDTQDKALLTRTSQELEVDISDVNLSTLSKAFKLAARTRLKVSSSAILSVSLQKNITIML